MKVASTKSQDVVSYTISSGTNWLIVLIECGLIVAAAAVALNARVSLWVTNGLVVLALLLRWQTSESVLAIADLGWQLEHKGRIRFWSDDSRFYPKHSVLAVLINEVFEGFEINYVLQMVVSDANEMSLVFPTLRPRLDVVKEVWQNIRNV